ncbi:hypothetical protein DSY14_02010 [Nocardiopsis sp. MG754419]|nr:hypothetical protein [Nocardiopsis sp. MG754419]
MTPVGTHDGPRSAEGTRLAAEAPTGPTTLPRARTARAITPGHGSVPGPADRRPRRRFRSPPGVTEEDTTP